MDTSGKMLVMPRAPCNFRQRDLTRAIKGARAAGIDVARIEIEKDGRIVLVFDEPAQSNDKLNPWDTVLNHAADPKRPS
jgi:hypothetical protein